MLSPGRTRTALDNEERAIERWLSFVSRVVDDAKKTCVDRDDFVSYCKRYICVSDEDSFVRIYYSDDFVRKQKQVIGGN